MAKEKKYRFYEKPHNRNGIFSAALAGASVALFLLAVLISYIRRGNGGAVTGGLGLIAILLSVYGFIMGMRSLKDRKTSSFFGIAGAMGCGIMAVIWLTLFLMGV